MAGTELADPCAKGEGLSLRPHLHRLPTELIIKIISIVEGFQHCPKPPLTACALVSHSWNTLCRPHMFHRVNLYQSTIYYQLSSLHFQLPHLSQYIHTLTFNGCAAATIVSKAEWFPACFAWLTNLHKLWLMSGMDGPLPAVSLAMFAAPQLRKLYILGLRFDGVYDLLSLFPPALEELILDIKFDRSPDNIVKRELELKALRIPGIWLDTLRSLKILCGFKSILAIPHLIECPNLACLVVSCRPGPEPLYLPPWLPASLLELVLSCGPHSVIPHFGRALRPALVTLSMRSLRTSPYLDLFTWARDCIESLPDPHAIRALTINIDSGYYHYPTLSDYEMFSQFLYHLRGNDYGSCLQSIILHIKLLAQTSTASYTPDGVEAWELAKLEKGFAQLVEDNVLDTDLILLSPDQEPEGSAPPVWDLQYHAFFNIMFVYIRDINTTIIAIYRHRSPLDTALHTLPQSINAVMRLDHRLKAFAKVVDLQPGQSKKVVLNLDKYTFSY
ncbi:hypothetical protein BDN71DRAFT_1502478 [Pleurotus eryngii]|uniref:F-box domain-containing protein n=1 Tax=Pleurotus eryngii TaxID=5323 RepID=A0A9P6DJY3_PLEER|nr:hypothetical protein BDN71DRAFT_1502478 [Pleurotus eryngii]